MAIGAQPLGPRDVKAILDRKMADFAHAARSIRLVHMPTEPYFDAAADDPDVRFAIETGFMSAVEDELRDPVLVDLDEHRVLACPPLAHHVLTDEPPELHRAFVEGAFFRKLFRFFVPATHEGGERWEANQQVREIMQRHFPFQLVAVETVLGQAS